MSVQLYLGDCLEVMRSLPENSIDTCITDPPYHLTSIVKRFGGENAAPAQYGTDGAFARASKGFMGKTWDGGNIAADPATWAEVYRVLKPGAILLAFGGTRTYHRMVCAIEDAGFEIRDMIEWMYGSGFPKSLDIGKAIDKRAGVEREVIGKELVDIGMQSGNMHAGRNSVIVERNVTKGDSGWDGWGTALKPAHEPIVVAMKPVDGTFVNNALTWGVAGLWIDGGRVETDGSDGGVWGSSNKTCQDGRIFNASPNGTDYRSQQHPQGRFPANVIHDGSDEVTGLFPQTNGSQPRVQKVTQDEGKQNCMNVMMRPSGYETPGYTDSGSAARFFYCAKSSRRERNNGLDSYVTVKYNNDKSNNGGISWKDASTVAVQLLRRVISESVTLSFNIGESGESITVLCPKDSLSITLTAINKIIESKTLHSLTLSLTNDYTVDANCETVNGGSLVESVESLKKWILTTTNGHLELARGASSAALNMLLRIKNADAWSQATNIHSTVKPLALMRYLARLTKTPTGGVVLDPFMGSGTTGIACALEGREFIGIEREPEYIEIAEKRIAYWSLQPGLEVE